MLAIEWHEPVESAGECCQNTTFGLTRIVYEDDNASAIYRVVP